MLTGHELRTLRRHRLARFALNARWPRLDGELVVCLTWGVLFILITFGGGLDSLLA